MTAFDVQVQCPGKDEPMLPPNGVWSVNGTDCSPVTLTDAVVRWSTRDVTT